MPREETNYWKEAREDAVEMVNHFEDEIVEQLIDKGEASDDYNNDYPDGDSYHHETHTDRGYTLLEAAKLLDDLSEYEESDSGLWEGLEPRRAVEVQAAFTYGNAVGSFWSDLIRDINEAYNELGGKIKGAFEWAPDEEPFKPEAVKKIIQEVIKDWA